MSTITDPWICLNSNLNAAMFGCLLLDGAKLICTGKINRLYTMMLVSNVFLLISMGIECFNSAKAIAPGPLGVWLPQIGTYFYLIAL
ncbi:hypothetical protein HDU91_006875, partial [Kappamyces sp. JEL0680]